MGASHAYLSLDSELSDVSWLPAAFPQLMAHEPIIHLAILSKIVLRKGFATRPAFGG
jgi:hypothetical protein